MNRTLIAGAVIGAGLAVAAVAQGQTDFGQDDSPAFAVGTIELATRFAGAMLTPLIAVVATYIAWQQWQTNRQKLVMDRYDRRLRVYEEVRKILSIIARDANVSTDDLLKFRTSVSEADFLFGPEIMAYIDEIYRRGLNLWRCNVEYRDRTQEQPQGYDHEKVVDEKYKELTWLTEQFEPAKQKFKKYLDISR